MSYLGNHNRYHCKSLWLEAYDGRPIYEVKVTGSQFGSLNLLLSTNKSIQHFGGSVNTINNNMIPVGKIGDPRTSNMDFIYL